MSVTTGHSEPKMLRLVALSAILSIVAAQTPTPSPIAVLVNGGGVHTNGVSTFLASATGVVGRASLQNSGFEPCVSFTADSVL